MLGRGVGPALPKAWFRGKDLGRFSSVLVVERGVGQQRWWEVTWNGATCCDAKVSALTSYHSL
jgi:hypothetical protein